VRGAGKANKIETRYPLFSCIPTKMSIFHVNIKFHVSLKDYEEIVKDTYSVLRSDGEIDSGWKVSHESVREISLCGPSATKHYKYPNAKSGWRIFLDNGCPDYYCCGWRHIDSIYPTQLSGDDNAIKVWRQELLELLEFLETKRLECIHED
jgi:hypothetical protein